MKKIMLLLIIIVLLANTVSADILWEPLDNEYYWEHYEETQGVHAKYEVPEGMTVNIYTAPSDGTLIKTLEAGTVVYVGQSAEINGEIWAAGYPLWDYETEGWFRLGRLQKQYSHYEFTKEFSSDISSDGGELIAANIGGSIYTWTYPGSGCSDGILEQELLESGSDYNDGKVSYDLVYTDPNGGKWGYIGYYMGRVGWMYLDDPTNPEPPLTLDVTIENTVTDTAPEDNAPQRQSANSSYIIVFIAVAALIAVTSIGVLILKKKEK